MPKLQPCLKNCFKYLLMIMLPALMGCEDAMEKNYKYQRPEWLDGKVYDVAKAAPELKTFTAALEKTGLNELINSSGLYTVLAPSDEAFKAYFTTNPAYNSIDDMDTASLKRLIQFHIVVMPYSKQQIRTLNTNGWIRESDDDPWYNTFKRETLVRPDNYKLKVTKTSGGNIIIDENGTDEMVVYSGTNKYAPFFFSEYMEANKVVADDFLFYFDRNTFDMSEIYYGGAKLTDITTEEGNTQEAYTAENGYVYVLDQVVEVMENAYENLFNTNPNTPTYNDFGDLINEFSEFVYNEEATYAQEGADEGLEVDKLWDLTYPTLAFQLLNEASYSVSKHSIAVHHALFAPSNEAYNRFISSVVITNKDDHYFTMTSVPAVTKRAIVNTHTTYWDPYLQSKAGPDGNIYNYDGQRVDLTGIGIEETDFGSNATFLGLDKVMLPRYLSSVAAPIALRRTYNSFFWAMYSADALTTTSNKGGAYTIFPISDEYLARDSTLYVNASDSKTEEATAEFEVYDKGELDQIELPLNSTEDHLSVRAFVNGQISIGIPKNNSNREYLRNLLGYYTIIDHTDNTVSGGKKSTGGYNGGNILTLTLDNELIEDFGTYGQAPDNGRTFGVEGWFQFPKTYFTDEALKQSVNGNKVNTLFLDLLESVGLVVDGRYTFISESEALTVFHPTDAAITASQIDTLPDDELEVILKNHFISGVNLFTDNFDKLPSPDKYYTKSNSRILLGSSEPNKIDIMYEDGSLFYAVEDSVGATNLMYLGFDDGDEDDDDTYENKILSGIATVVHQINSVIPTAIVLD